MSLDRARADGPERDSPSPGRGPYGDYRSATLGAILVLAGVLFQALWLGLPAVVLSVGLVVSYGLWIGTDWRFTPRLRAVFPVAIGVFVAHLAEETLTGFDRALPALFDRAAWSDPRFLAFNGVWLVAFVLASLTVAASRPLPVLVILFFAVTGGVGNGAAHLLLALQRGGYFPGLWTAPLCLAMGVWLLRVLYRPRPGPGSPA